MFESAEVGHRIPKDEYRVREAKLREDLLKAQYDLLGNPRFPVIIIIGGVDGAGKGETVNLLNEWMDPRHIVTCSFGEMSDEEAERPPMWRFARAVNYTRSSRSEAVLPGHPSVSSPLRGRVRAGRSP